MLPHTEIRLYSPVTVTGDAVPRKYRGKTGKIMWARNRGGGGGVAWVVEFPGGERAEFDDDELTLITPAASAHQEPNTRNGGRA